MVILDAVQVFAALADPARLSVVRMLAESPEVACTALEQVLNIRKSTISYHIRILRHARLITVVKDGRFYRYTLRRDTIEQCMPGLLDLICSLPLEQPGLSAYVAYREQTDGSAVLANAAGAQPDV